MQCNDSMMIRWPKVVQTWRVLSQREMQWKWKAWLHLVFVTFCVVKRVMFFLQGNSSSQNETLRQQHQQVLNSHSPSDSALLAGGRGLVGLALDAQVHDVVPGQSGSHHLLSLQSQQWQYWYSIVNTTQQNMTNGNKGTPNAEIRFWLISFPSIQKMMTVAHSITSWLYNILYTIYQLHTINFLLKDQPADGAVVDNNVPSPQSHSIPLLNFKSEPNDRTVTKVNFMK